jgi:phospholipase C
MRVPYRRPAYAMCLVVALGFASFLWPASGDADAWEAAHSLSLPSPAAATKIRHVVIILQENRSFDSYFGTFPGADGIPMDAQGVPTVCIPDPRRGQCVKPFHDSRDENFGGPHTQAAAQADIDSGAMDGFIAQQEQGAQRTCQNPDDPNCTPAGRLGDVVGYHTAREIPNYWEYARQFVLQDRMFEPNASWSLPAHLFLVSAWSAGCSSADPMSCQNQLESPAPPGNGAPYAWTDLTYVLHAHGVSWAYYVAPGTQPDCEDGAMRCAQPQQQAASPSIWNPLPAFETVQADGQVGNVQDVANFYVAAPRPPR